MENFAQKLLDWHDRNARDLPWRGETDPYKIWVSEIMLQQTRTETVKEYYRRFLTAFPDVFALAAAPEDRVLKMWEGLGYYSRARNLQAAAKVIVSRFGGKLPESRAELMQLPGIGEYASGAIASIAFAQRVPALDGNQARVLSRIWDLEETIRTPAQLYDRSLPLVPPHRPGDYNQALMGLGALVCLPKNPRCEACPVSAECRALANGTQQQRPVKPERRAQKQETVLLAVVYDQDGLLMRRRGPGMLAGLWEYPNFPGARSREDLESALQESGIHARYVRKLGENRHEFTHRIWQIGGYLYRLARTDADCPYEKVSWAAVEALAVPTAFQPYTQMLREGRIP